MLKIYLENSNRLNRSHRSGVLTASGWFGGKHTSPEFRSWHGIPYLSRVARGCAEHQPEEKSLNVCSFDLHNFKFESKKLKRFDEILSLHEIISKFKKNFVLFLYIYMSIYRLLFLIDQKNLTVSSNNAWI